MNTLSCLKYDYPEVYERSDKKALSWIFKTGNQKLLTEKFGKKFPKSPYDFVVQIKTDRGTMLVTSDGDFKKTERVSYLKWSTLKKLGCSSSF